MSSVAPAVKQSQGHLHCLTILRGLSALFVIISHALNAAEGVYFDGDSQFAGSWLHSLGLGTFGVLLFFALSGATLYLSNKHKVGSSVDVICFYIKRFMRIWPAFIISLIGYIAFRPVFQSLYGDPQGYWIEKQFLMPFTFTDLMAYLTLSFNFLGQGGLFNNAYWSLPVEFQYYLIFPVCIWAITKFGGWSLLAISLALYALPRTVLDIGESGQVFLFAYSFIGGIFVGAIYEKYQWVMPGRYLLAMALSLFIFVSAVGNEILPLPNLVFISNIWNFYALAAILMVLLTIHMRFDLKGRLSQFFAGCGEISYSLYLYHNLFLGMSLLIYLKSGLISPEYKLFFLVLFTCVFSYITSRLSYSYIEKPSVAIGKRVSSLLEQKIAPSASLST